MECIYLKELCMLFVYLLGNMFFYFMGSFVSESQCQDILGIVIVFEQIGYFISEYMCFFGIGIGDDQ